ncbi:MAG: cation diffusion facilitator family transporter [Candidatus Lokiarchaeota archaeon]|nr:cation diffusion facilitator family transporter [Candidatus Lokiarchaeota archaeon]
MKNAQTPNDRIFEYREVEKKRLIISLVITVSVMIVEILGGFFANSIALITDAGHMFTHAFAISISLFAIYLAQKPTCHHRTFGMYRAEVLAAFINGLFLLVMVGFIIFEAIERLLNPVDIEIIYMIFIALIGLSVNLISILILQGSRDKDLNVKGVFYHMIGDAISSVGVVVAAIIIYYTGFSFLDPLIGFLIAGLIISWSINILGDSGRILLEMAPKGLDVDTIENDLAESFKEIEEVKHTHLWTITPSLLVLTTHLQLQDDVDQDEFLQKVTDYIHQKFNITESTIQVSFTEDIKSCRM